MQGPEPTTNKSLLGRLADAIDPGQPTGLPRSRKRRIKPMAEIRGARNLLGLRKPGCAPRPTDSVVRLLDGVTVYRYFDDGSLRLDGGRAHRGHAAKVARKKARRVRRINEDRNIPTEFPF